MQDLIERLRQNGVDFKALTKSNENIFHLAAYNHNPLMLESLLNTSFEGVDINLLNKNKETPLLNYITQREEEKIIFQQEKYWPDYVKIVQLFKTKGADLNVKNADGLGLKDICKNEEALKLL